MPHPFSVLSCAKINLSLDIVGTRADGYHELRSVAHTIALCDEIDFRFDSSGQWLLECDDASLHGPDNLCLKAARLWEQAAREAGLGQPVGGKISLRKRIPHGAGLGGGSGNAWAVLESLSRAYDPHAEILTLRDLEALAKTLGADVPMFAHGGAMLLEGIGEKITPLAPLEAWAVIAQPQARISTPACFRAWDASGLQSGEASGPLLEVWDGKERLQRIAGRLGNDLREAARSLGVPVDVGVAALLEAGALGAEMTGSGSAVFGLCRDEEQARGVEERARGILDRAAHKRDGWRLWRAALCDYGARLEAGGQAAAST